MTDGGAALRAATAARSDPQSERLLHVDPGGERLDHRRIGDLPHLLRPGDLLVVNDAATVPASLRVRTDVGEPFEIRLLAWRGGSRWLAVLFGAGDWRIPTERRPPPPGGSHRRLALVDLARPEEAMWSWLYRTGAAVQYAHRLEPVPIAEMQTPWAARPWAVEMPSAGRPLTREMVLRLRSGGVEVARVTHAAGLSSTGDAELDRQLPLPERYDVPRETVDAVRRARSRSGRVVAAGTTVVRALEGAARAGAGELVPGEGVTDLRIGPGHRPAVVDGLLTGIHAPGESHFELLTAFAPRRLLLRATAESVRRGYLAHELGDSMLVL